MEKLKCSCNPEWYRKNGFGTGNNQVVLEIPDNVTIYYNNPNREERKDVAIDHCLTKEIEYLWNFGIRTTGCCCGHNISIGYIGVHPDNELLMRSLGYQQYEFENDPSRTDSFIPQYKIPEN